jgi:predicted nucleic acid-binding protein
MEAGAFRWLSQDAEVFSRIREVYQKLPGSVLLRAADAIHLATAVESGFRIVFSNDAHLLAAAQHFGIQEKNIIGQAS